MRSMPARERVARAPAARIVHAEESSPRLHPVRDAVLADRRPESIAHPDQPLRQEAAVRSPITPTRSGSVRPAATTASKAPTSPASPSPNGGSSGPSAAEGPTPDVARHHDPIAVSGQMGGAEGAARSLVLFGPPWRWRIDGVPRCRLPATRPRPIGPEVGTESSSQRGRGKRRRIPTRPVRHPRASWRDDQHSQCEYLGAATVDPRAEGQPAAPANPRRPPRPMSSGRSSPSTWYGCFDPAGSPPPAPRREPERAEAILGQDEVGPRLAANRAVGSRQVGGRPPRHDPQAPGPCSGGRRRQCPGGEPHVGRMAGWRRPRGAGEAFTRPRSGNAVIALVARCSRRPPCRAEGEPRPAGDQADGHVEVTWVSCCGRTSASLTTHRWRRERWPGHRRGSRCGDARARARASRPTAAMPPGLGREGGRRLSGPSGRARAVRQLRHGAVRRLQARQTCARRSASAPPLRWLFGWRADNATSPSAPRVGTVSERGRR
jgi:hypothetical protein